VFRNVALYVLKQKPASAPRTRLKGCDNRSHSTSARERTNRNEPDHPPRELRSKLEVVVRELDSARFSARAVPEAFPNQFIVVGELSAARER
jgi:hypothetical protein